MIVRRNSIIKSINQINQIFIFDTNIFLKGINFNLIKEEIYTTQNVLDEIKVSRYQEKNRNILNRIHAAIDNNKLIIKSPQVKYFNKVVETSKQTGDFKILSETDIELIALTLEFQEQGLNVILYTNDYSMENVCSELKVQFSALGINGIQSKMVFEAYCPFCEIIYPPDFLNMYCERCGEKIRRRRKKNGR
ncbi:MAG: PIN domain-containing protein [Candidatus Lokiarchaeota archaeon]